MAVAGGQPRSTRLSNACRSTPGVSASRVAIDSSNPLSSSRRRRQAVTSAVFATGQPVAEHAFSITMSLCVAEWTVAYLTRKKTRR